MVMWWWEVKTIFSILVIQRTKQIILLILLLLKIYILRIWGFIDFNSDNLVINTPVGENSIVIIETIWLMILE